jgi:hypothetical protein
VTEKQFSLATSSIFDGNVVPWALVGLMLVVAFVAVCWIILPN